MAKLLPFDQFPTALDHGDYVALGLEEFWAAYDTFSAGVTGELPRDPTFPETYQDAATGKQAPMPDTPFDRAWYAAGKLITDDAKRISFFARVGKVMVIALDRKYAKFDNYADGSLHVALLAAVAAVPFSSRTTTKALRAAFDAEFRRRLMLSVEAGGMRH